MSSISMGMQVVLSIVLGISFLAAAIPKLRDPKGFVLVVLEYRLLPRRLSWLYARLLPPLECLLALLLLSGTMVRSAAVVLSLLMLSFIVGIGINLARGRKLDCHCFGKAARRTIGWGLLIEDVALLCVAIALAIFASQWKALESWSLFRLAGLVQTGSIGPLLGCGALTVCIAARLGRSTYSRRLYGSAEASK